VAPLAARGPSPALGALHLALATLLQFTGRYGEAVEAAEMAIAVARALQASRLLATAQGARGRALETMGRNEEGYQALLEALRLAEADGDLGNPSDIEVLQHLAYLVADTRLDQAAALRYAGRALHLAEQLGDPHYIASALNDCGMFHLQAMDWVSAGPLIERAVALHRRCGDSARTADALSHLARLRFLEGAGEEAVALAEESLAIASGAGDTNTALFNHATLAMIELREGRAAAARARLLPLLGLPGLQRQQMWWVVPYLARAQLELGEVREARRLALQAVGYARANGELGLLGIALLVHAMVATRRGRWQEAERALAEGLEIGRRWSSEAADGGAPFLEAYGQWRAAKGEPERAREKLEAALAMFRRLGARRDIERIEQLLGTLR
jgi:tetratricopeptide (TPR) repeat protein